MRDENVIVVLEGDQTGQELLEEALRVLEPAVIGVELEFPRTPESPARVALVEAVAGRAGGLHVTPPLVERGPRGYTPEMQTLLAKG